MSKKTDEPVKLIDKLKHLLKPETLIDVKIRSYGFHTGFFDKYETCQLKKIDNEKIECLNVDTGQILNSTIHHITKIDGMDLKRLGKVYK